MADKKEARGEDPLDAEDAGLSFTQALAAEAEVAMENQILSQLAPGLGSEPDEVTIQGLQEEVRFRVHEDPASASLDDVYADLE